MVVEVSGNDLPQPFSLYGNRVVHAPSKTAPTWPAFSEYLDVAVRRRTEAARQPLNNTGRRDEPHLISAKELALGLPKRTWRTIRWREGSADWLSSRFTRVRVGVGHNQLIPELLLQDWLLIEWPEGEAEPTKYYCRRYRRISASANSSIAKLRWRVVRPPSRREERDQASTRRQPSCGARAAYSTHRR